MTLADVFHWIGQIQLTTILGIFLGLWVSRWTLYVLEKHVGKAADRFFTRLLDLLLP